MKLGYNLISNFDKQRLVSFVVVLFIINESKRYWVSDINMSDVGVERGSG